MNKIGMNILTELVKGKVKNIDYFYKKYYNEKVGGELWKKLLLIFFVMKVVI